MPKTTLSFVDMLAAARVHRAEIDDLIRKLEVLTGARASPLIPPPPTAAAASSASRKVAAAEKLLVAASRATRATTNGHPVKGSRPPARRPGRRPGRRGAGPGRPHGTIATGPSLAALILDDLARHPGSNAIDVRTRLDVGGVWRTSSGDPANVLGVNLRNLTKRKRIIATRAHGVTTYRVRATGRPRAAEDGPIVRGPSVATRVVDDLARHPDATVGEVVERLRASVPTMTSALVGAEFYRLRTRGRIERTGDAGAYRYRLTPDARELVAAASPSTETAAEPQDLTREG